MKAGKKDGFGEHVKPDGTKYTGDWVDGSMHGQGEQTRANGSVYTGTMQNDKRSGFGRLVFAGNVYEGAFENDAANGLGTYTFPDGSVYKGSMKDGYQNGFGELLLSNGYKYSGDFEMGQLSGLGKYEFPNSHIHLGRFKNSIYHGAGITIWKMGQTRFDTKYEDGPREGLPSNSTVHTVFPYLKKKFLAFPTYKREKIQSNLKRKGLYTSSVDGKWGRGTLTALVEFSLSNMGTVDLRSQAASKRLLAAVLQ